MPPIPGRSIRRSSPTETMVDFTVRIPASLKERIATQAADKSLSLNFIANQAFLEYLALVEEPSQNA